MKKKKEEEGRKEKKKGTQKRIAAYWIFITPQNTYGEAISPNQDVMVFGDGTLGSKQS